MDKHTLESILEQVCEEEFSEFSEPPKHKFRLKNRIRMRKVLSRYKRNCTVHIPVRRMNRRLVTAIVVAILLAAMAVTAAAVLLLKGFVAKEHEDNTQLFAENIAGAPTVIEEIYYIPELPDGYELAEYHNIDISVYSMYIDENNGNVIVFNQYVKSKFDTHYDNNAIYPVVIGEHDGIYINHSDQMISSLIWDNGDYIMHLEGILSREEIIAIAESIEIKK